MHELRVITGQRVVTAAGTPERINEETNKYRAKIINITFKANTTNTDYVYICGPEDKPTITTTGFVLSAGETLTLDVSSIYDAFIDLQNVWFDSVVNGEGLSYVAFEVI